MAATDPIPLAPASETPAAAPTQPTSRCPLCNGPNGCEVAATGGFPDRCWCVDVKFSASLLAKLTPEQQGKACICRRCAQAQD